MDAHIEYSPPVAVTQALPELRELNEAARPEVKGDKYTK